MTRFDNIKAKNIDEFVEWLDKHGAYDDSSWSNWFDNNYCQQCERIVKRDNRTGWHSEYAWCELNGKCRYFQYMDAVPSNRHVIKMWLESEDDKYEADYWL